MGQVQDPLANITGCIPQYFAMTASAERLMEAETLPREERGEEAACTQELAGFAGLELRGVSCRYASIADDSEAAGEGRLVRCPDVSIACDERVWDALRVAGADFVSALPDGLDTRLGESGAGLSEGQVQRLAIARAIFADRPVLLLDEATCSLDPETERRVLENLRALPDKTVIAVTHRPAALEVCNRQVRFGVMWRGRTGPGFDPEKLPR